MNNVHLFLKQDFMAYIWLEIKQLFLQRIFVLQPILPVRLTVNNILFGIGTATRDISIETSTEFTDYFYGHHVT